MDDGRADCDLGGTSAAGGRVSPPIERTLFGRIGRRDLCPNHTAPVEPSGSRAPLGPKRAESVAQSIVPMVILRKGRSRPRGIDELLVATTNQGKIRELEALLGDLP